jgi:serine/threonine-protein kinase
LWDNADVLGLSPGQVVADKYRIDGIIGSGGMGVVVAATHLELDQRVAIKLLRDASPDSLARFQREARLIVRLKSPHVARVFDVGTLDNEMPFIVMEFLEGEDFSRLIDRRFRVPVSEAVDWVLEACEAVAEAHTLGMVHRDLKPANLFLARGPGGSGTVKVLDFGISKHLDAKLLEGTAGGLTNEGVALGSPGYMSPEQMTSSRDVDARSDIYALGAILYRLTGGQNPYKGDSLVSVLASMAMTPLPPLRSAAPDIPDRFASIVERCLAQDAGARPANVAELAQLLAPFGTRKARASADQIAATMGTAAPDLRVLDASSGGLGGPTPTLAMETVPARAMTPRAAHAPPYPASGGPSTPRRPSHAPPLAHPSYPPAVDRSDTGRDPPRRREPPRLTGLVVALVGATLLTGAVGWVAIVRKRDREPAFEEPPIAESAAPVGNVTPVLPSSALPIVTPPPPLTAPPPTAPEPRPLHPSPRPRHGTHRTTTADPSAPPSPTDVPASRR